MNYLFLLLISLISMIVLIKVELTQLSNWREAQSFFGNSKKLQQKLIQILCLIVVISYTAIIVHAIFVNNDFSRILVLGSQGAVLLNFLIHFGFKFIWKLKMPALYSSLFLGIIPAAFLTFFAYNYWWFSKVLFFQVLFLGMFSYLIVIIFLWKLIEFFYTNLSSDYKNDWEDF